MKRFLTLLLAVASLAAVSCEKEQEVKIEITSETGLVKMSVLAHSPEVNADTKTSLADNGSLYWSYGDHICVYDGYGCRDFSSDIKQVDDPTKVTTFDGEIQSGATDFKAVYPYSSSVSYSEGKFLTTIPETQYAVVGSFANKANVAVANSATSYVSDDDNAMAEFTFSNVGALVKFTISQDGVHKGVTLRAFTKPATEKVYAKIAGEIQIVPATAIATATENGAEAVSIEAESGYLAAGVYYAVILPITDQKLSFTFTDGYSTKTRSTKTAVSIGRSSYYDMRTIDEGITYPDPFEGEWVLTGVDTNPYLLSQYVEGNVYPAVQAASIDNGVVTVTGSKAHYKVTIAKEAEGDYAGMYTIKDAGDLYLTASGANSNNYMKGLSEANRTAGSYWTISEESGLFTIEATKYSGNRNQIRVNHNNGSPRFTCYQSSNTTQPKVTLYRFADVVETLEPTANPTISCSNNMITITCSTEGATIYYVIGENEANTPDPTDASAEYDADNKPTIDANSYVKAYAIADGYAASEIVGQAVNYVAPGTDVIYEKYRGALTEGSYIVSYFASNTYYHMANSANGNRILYTNDAVDNDQIINPDASIVWTIAQSGDYWTIYNSSSGYAGGTTTKNQGAILNSVTDYALWSVESDANTTAYDFVNKGRENGSSDTGNKYLRCNTQTVSAGTGRFACYADGTGGALTLYKLQDNTVWDLKCIAVKTEPKKTYEAGENFDPTGLVITATYEDNAGEKDDKTVDVAYSNETASAFTFDPSTSTELTTSDESVNISYTVGEITRSTTQAITVTAPITWDLKGISVTTPPTKTVYTAGESFDPYGMVVTATYENHNNTEQTKQETVDIDNLSLSPDTETPLTTGDTAITITYYGKSTTQLITVNAANAAEWVETALSDISDGDVFVIVGNNVSALPNDITTSCPAYTSITISNNKLASAPDDNLKWNVSGNATNGYTFYPNGDSQHWLCCTTTASSSNNDKIRVGTSERKVWTLNNNSYLVTNDDYSARYLSIYTTQDWRGYLNTSNNPAALKFYKYTVNDGKFNAGVTLSYSGGAITYGDSPVQLSLTNSNGVTVSCSSSATGVATVTNAAVVTIVGAGTTTITASWDEQTIGGKTYRAGSVTYELTVAKKTPIITAFSNPNNAVAVNGTVTNTTTISDNLTITYTSSDETVATVTSGGVVTGLKNGTATISATFAGNTNFNAAESQSYTITVGTGGGSGGNKTEYTATLTIRSVSNLAATYDDDKGNTWSASSDAQVYTSNTAYLHAGSGKKTVSHITLSTSAYSSVDIKEIHVWAAAKAGSGVTTKISIDGNLLGTSSELGNTASSGGTEFSVTNSSNHTGEIEVVISRSSAEKAAIYFNQLMVIYEAE